MAEEETPEPIDRDEERIGLAHVAMEELHDAEHLVRPASERQRAPDDGLSGAEAHTPEAIR